MTILVTGAAGKVARMLRPGLDGLRLRAVDVREISDWGADESAVGDLADPAFAAAAADGVRTVVHLAANPAAYASWPDLREPNVEAVVNLLDSAKAAGVRKVVLASSVHAMGGYFEPGEAVVDPSWPVRPCCAYGATKVFAEGYGHVVATTSDVDVICLRLGACLPEPVDSATLAARLAPSDLQQLVRAALSADVRYGTYFGVSANTRAAFDYGNAYRDLGYEPRFDSEPYAGDVPAGSGGMCRLERHER